MIALLDFAKWICDFNNDLVSILSKIQPQFGKQPTKIIAS